MLTAWPPRSQGYTYTSGVPALCCAATLTVVAEKPGASATDVISPTQLSATALSMIQQSPSGNPTNTTQSSSGRANSTAAYNFPAQNTVDSAATALDTISEINRLAIAAGLPCGTIVKIYGQSSAPMAFSCLPVPVSERLAVSSRGGEDGGGAPYHIWFFKLPYNISNILRCRNVGFLFPSRATPTPRESRRCVAQLPFLWRR